VLPDFDYAARIERARSLMADRGIDALMLSVGADLPYFTGYEAMPLERLTMFVLAADAEPVLVVPRLEAPRVDTQGDFAIRAWDETDDPVRITADLAHGAARVALGDTTWSTFLLGLQAAMAGCEFVDASTLTRELRMRKERAEIDLLRAAAEATDRVVASLESVRFAGRSEREVATDVRAMTVEEGHEESTFHIVASGPNAASPHHEPGDRVIERGDTVVIDFGGRLHGYCSDTTRTFSVGEPSAEVVEAYEVLEAAQAAARAEVRPGVAPEAVDAAAREIIDAAGYGDRFLHRTGHGIGLEAHEHPYIVEGNAEPLEEGMTFSIEPGIYTAGAWGMRLEDIVVCGAGGVVELNRSERHLRVVE
jgi:Xaa-Pro aminopeptidase